MRKIGIGAERVRDVSAWRLLVAVLTLYALAVGGVLNSAASSRAEHANVICQQIAVQDQNPASSGEAPSDQHHMSDCCIGVAAASLHLPSVVGADLNWPRLRALGPIHWRVTTGAIRGPPRESARPRAPPFESIA